jgi:siroheme synthase
MTLVIYMGVSRAAAIQCALVEAGLPGSTPAVVVENATLPRERRVCTDLARLAEDIAAHDITSPAIMVIGEVAAAAAEFDEDRRAYAAAAEGLHRGASV